MTINQERAQAIRRMREKIDRPINQYGRYKGDVVVCKTCGKSFTVEKTVKWVREICSIACRRPAKDIIEKGLSLMRELSVDQKNARAKEFSKTMTGRPARGRSAKGKINHKAKFYELNEPNHQAVHNFKNLRLFIRTHQHLFSSYELRTYKSCRPGTTYAELGLRSLFGLKKNGDLKVSHWHGWTIGDKSEKPLP